MIERGILPEGTELTPINPMTRRHVRAERQVRPWDTLSDEEKALFCRMAEVYAGFSEYTDAQVGRIIDYLEESGPARQHLDLLLRRQRRVGRGQPERFGQREQVLQRLSGRHRGQPAADRQARHARTPTTTTRRDGRSASPRPTACSSATPYQGGVCDPMVIHWPAGHQGAGAKCAISTTTAPTSCRRSSMLRREFPDVVQRRQADAAAGRLDAVQLRRRPTRRLRRSRSTTRCSATAASGIRAGRPSTEHGPTRRTRQLRRATAGSCSTPTTTAPRPTMSPTSTPRRSRS